MNKITKLIPTLLVASLLTACPHTQPKTKHVHIPEFAEYGEEVARETYVEQLNAKRQAFYENFATVKTRTYYIGETAFTEPVVYINPAYDYRINGYYYNVGVDRDSDTDIETEIEIDATNKRFKQRISTEGILKPGEKPHEEVYSEVKDNKFYFVDIARKEYEEPTFSEKEKEYFAMRSACHSSIFSYLALMVFPLIYSGGFYDSENPRNKYYINGDIFTHDTGNTLYQLRLTATEYSLKQVWGSSIFEEMLMSKEDINIDAYDYSNFEKRGSTFENPEDYYD